MGRSLLLWYSVVVTAFLLFQQQPLSAKETRSQNTPLKCPADSGKEDSGSNLGARADGVRRIPQQFLQDMPLTEELRQQLSRDESSRESAYAQAEDFATLVPLSAELKTKLYTFYLEQARLQAEPPVYSDAEREIREASLGTEADVVGKDLFARYEEAKRLQEQSREEFERSRDLAYFSEILHLSEEQKTAFRNSFQETPEERELDKDMASLSGAIQPNSEQRTLLRGLLGQDFTEEVQAYVEARGGEEALPDSFFIRTSDGGRFLDTALVTQQIQKQYAKKWLSEDQYKRFVAWDAQRSSSIFQKSVNEASPDVSAGE